jgi:cell division protein FtsB
MLGFYQKRKLKRYLYSKPTLAVLAVIALLFGNAAWSALGKERDARIRKNSTLAELASLEARELMLKEEIERLSTKRGIEEEIRSKFDVGLEGEKLIVVLDAKEDQTGEDMQKKGFWSGVEEWFGF